MKKMKFPLIFVAGALMGILSTLDLTTVRELLSMRVADVFADIKYGISPPEEVVFIPQGAVIPTLAPDSKSRTESNVSELLPTAIPTFTPSASEHGLTATPIPVPQEIELTGFIHEYQTWNNCGPATLSMALSFWGWKGNQQPIAAFTKPNARDKNVMPYEMVAFVEEKTQFQAITRVGGEIELLKRLLAAGFPVIIEKGFELPDEGWMGHYELVTGYDDSESRFTLQDSYFGPDQVLTYDDLYTNWRAFNYTYIVVFPRERKQVIESILGQNMDEEYNFRRSAETAALEIYSLTGRDRFFAWFNRGTNLVWLQDYSGSAEAYDAAFSSYGNLPEEQRPWRMMWYQTGPYRAYYYTGRYHDVINLSTQTLDAMSEAVLEESYYWRAMAKMALGNSQKAMEDLEKSLKYHPGFEPALIQLQQYENTP